MRGLTPAERAVLASYPAPGAYLDTSYDEVDDFEAAVLDDLERAGRVAVFSEGSDGRVLDITPLGRLALRLWPATAATPGAGGQ